MANNYGLFLWRIDEKFKTKKAFCEAVGITTATLMNYTSGKNAMPSTFIAKACELLEIPTEEIGLYFFTCNEDFCTQ